MLTKRLLAYLAINTEYQEEQYTIKIHSRKNDKWCSAGVYKTKEEALEVVKQKYGLGMKEDKA